MYIMLSNKFTRILVVGALAASLGNAAFAYSKPSSSVADPFGATATEVSAVRTINLDSGTRYVNVKRGEIIKFTSGGKSFTWNFDTLGMPNFDLSTIAPADMNAANVRVYVAPSDLDVG
jgi:hypothetical protein